MHKIDFVPWKVAALAADWKPGSGLGENTERAIEGSAAKRSQRTF